MIKYTIIDELKKNRMLFNWIIKLFLDISFFDIPVLIFLKYGNFWILNVANTRPKKIKNIIIKLFKTILSFPKNENIKNIKNIGIKLNIE